MSVDTELHEEVFPCRAPALRPSSTTSSTAKAVAVRVRVDDTGEGRERPGGRQEWNLDVAASRE